MFEKIVELDFTMHGEESNCLWYNVKHKENKTAREFYNDLVIAKKRFFEETVMDLEDENFTEILGQMGYEVNEIFSDVQFSIY